MVIRLFLAVLALILIGSTSYAQTATPTDSVRVEQTDTISLGEVRVDGAAYTNRDDHVTLYLKKYNVDYGNNALDAVSSLSRFQQGIGLNSLTTLDHKNVTILINGVPADAMTLRSYRGKEIQKVEFYDYAPPQYMDLTKGPLVNIITRKRTDRLYSAYIYGWEGLMQTAGELQTALTYADSLNQVKINYYMNHGNNQHKDLSRYSYPGGTVNEYRGKGRNKYLGNNLTASYQRYTGKYLFNTTLLGYWLDSKDRTARSYSTPVYGGVFEGIGGDDRREKSDMASINLFFKHNVSESQAYTINVSGGYADASSHGHLWRESTQNPTMGYDIFNGVKNKSYSFNTRLGYQIKKLYIGAMYYYNRIDQKSGGAEYRPETQTAQIYAGHPFSRDNMSFSPSVGVTLSHSASMGISDTRTLPYVNLFYKLWAKEGKWDGLTGSARLTFGSGSVSGGQLTESETNLDNHFIIMGNPYLRTTWSVTGLLRLAYYRPDGKLTVQLDYNPRYNNRNHAPVIFRGDNGYFYQITSDLGHLWSHTLSLNGKWRVCDWFTMSPYLEYYKNNFTTPNREVDVDYFRAGGSVEFAYRDFTLYLTANSPLKTWRGDTYMFGTAQYASSIDWDRGNYSVGLRWNYLPQWDCTRGSGEGFSYTDFRIHKVHSLSLSVSLYFSRGKARRHPNAGGASGVDTGLRSDQTVKQ